jgi:CheY-like chemotaxis protein
MNFPDLSLPPLIIVDDSQDDAFMLRYRLRHGGIANPVNSFERPDDALSFLASSYVVGTLPMLVFVDIKMAGGFELVGEIRNDARFADTKVVAVTYSNNPNDLKRALELGVDGYILKFPDPDILAEFVAHGPWFAAAHHTAKASHALCA